LSGKIIAFVLLGILYVLLWIAAQTLYVPVFALPPFPKFELRSLHAATTCGSICGKALVACFR
jgi:hypothetical protein